MLNILKTEPTPVTIRRGPFRGARMFLNPANSKRKIFGLYEHCLNDWIAQAVHGKDFVIDVGGNTGYDAYGFAHLLLNGDTSRRPEIVILEPEHFPELEAPAGWPEYRGADISIVKKFAGSETRGDVITLDDAYRSHVKRKDGAGIVKIDIEGAEIDALKGSSEILDDPRHDWLIEIHGKALICEVARFFVERQRPFLIKSLDPLPLIGKERRTLHTCWLVTI